MAKKTFFDRAIRFLPFLVLIVGFDSSNIIFAITFKVYLSENAPAILVLISNQEYDIGC